MNTIPTLKSLNCELSMVKESDMNQLYRIMRDEDIKRFLPDFYEIIKKKEDFKSVMNSFAILWDKCDAILWGIYAKEMLIGFIGLLDISLLPTIFYAINKDFRGNGFAKEAVGSVIAYLAKSGITDWLQSEVLDENVASLTVLKNNGFIESDRLENKIILERQI